MPLVLTLKQGDDFYVGDTRFEVGAIHGHAKFRLFREDQQGNFCRHEISDALAVEILPDVYVSAGDAVSTNVAEVVLSAPRSIVVLRGHLWRESRQVGRV